MRKFLVMLTLATLFIISAQPSLAQRGGGARTGDDTTTDDGSTDATSSEDEGEAEARPLTFAENVLRDLAAWRHAQARKKLEAAEEEHGASKSLETAWALLLAEEKEYDEAVDRLTAAQKSDGGDPASAYYLGEIRSWKRQKDAAGDAWKDARDRAQKLLKSDADDAAARFWLGAALVRLGKFEDAEEELTAALNGGFDAAMTHFQLGLSMVYVKKWQEARKAFDACVEAEGAFAHAYFYRGLVFKELGKTEQMLLDMDRFVTLAPDAREVNAAQSILSAGG